MNAALWTNKAKTLNALPPVSWAENDREVIFGQGSQGLDNFFSVFPNGRFETPALNCWVNETEEAVWA